MLVLGIMNGTSADGIDYVWSQISGTPANPKIKFVKQVHKAFSPKIRKQILLAISNKLLTHELGELHHDLGREYARHFKSLKSPGKLHLIGLHGQTVFHKGRVASLQIGEPSYLAQAAGVPVIFNFRAADVAAGGEGAPLAPLIHEVLLKKYSGSTPVAFHNLGGISNLTYCYKKTRLAFDTGPASTLLDIWIQKKSNGRKQYDKDGALSSAGLPHLPTLKKMMAHSFLKKSPPKSCGREEYNMDFILKTADKAFFKLSLEDQLATLTEFTVASIYEAYKKFLPSLPKKIFFSGGGTANEFMMHRLKIYFKDSEVLKASDLGWPNSAIEGGAFGLMAYWRWNGQPTNLKSLTGGSSRLQLGQICEL